MAKHDLAVIILAAGQGKRMKSPLPKVLHALAGKPMINWLIDSAAALKPSKIVVVTSPDAKALQVAVKPHVTAVQPKANGTAGAVMAGLSALKGFKGDILVLVGDAPLISTQTMKDLIAAKKNAGLSVLAADVEDPFGYGRLITKNGILQKIVEEKDASTAEKECTLINTGVFCFDGAKLSSWLKKVKPNNAQKELYLTDLPAIAAKEGIKTNVCHVFDEMEVQGCNSKLDLAVLENTVQNQLRATHLVAGVTMIDPNTVYFHHDTKIGDNVAIEPNVFFGPGVTVGDNVTIKAFSHMEGAKISNGVSIGPFARLRPGSEIGEDVRIGNFVEVKKSKIGAGSKINHLAYVGDTVMGKDVNFSAGAITVNYDGFDKHETKIQDGAMVGSNVNLVAPVTVGKGAFIAAGSTITDNVPSDALAIEREPATVKKGWAADYRKKKKH